MVTGRHGRQGRGSGRRGEGLPIWLTAIVILVLLAYLGYALVVLEEKGLPFAYVLGGLLGAYGGVDHLLRRSSGKSTDDDEDPSGGGSA